MNALIDLINIFENKGFKKSPNDNAMVAAFIILYDDEERGRQLFGEHYDNCNNEKYKQKLYHYAMRLGINDI